MWSKLFHCRKISINISSQSSCEIFFFQNGLFGLWIKMMHTTNLFNKFRSQRSIDTASASVPTWISQRKKEYKMILSIMHPISMLPTTLAKDSPNGRHQTSTCIQNSYVLIDLWTIYGSNG
jgi:hypothetical protein